MKRKYSLSDKTLFVLFWLIIGFFNIPMLNAASDRGLNNGGAVITAVAGPVGYAVTILCLCKRGVDTIDEWLASDDRIDSLENWLNTPIDEAFDDKQ